jgi:hypothetical protein
LRIPAIRFHCHRVNQKRTCTSKPSNMLGVPKKAEGNCYPAHRVTLLMLFDPQWAPSKYVSVPQTRVRKHSYNFPLVRPLAARSLGLRLALALEIEGHCSADEFLQGRLIDLLAFVDVDGAPDISVEAGVE